MRKQIISWILALVLVIGVMGDPGRAAAQTQPITKAELTEFAARIRELAMAGNIRNDPDSEDARTEDGILLQYEFGEIYADRTEMNAETAINAAVIMDDQTAGPRGITISMDVNDVMAAVPNENPEMNGTYEQALLYLEGDPEGEFLYGLVERDGQRISAMAYGWADSREEKRIEMVLQISGDGVNAIRIEGMDGKADAGDLAEAYSEMAAVGARKAYCRVLRSFDGSVLEEFQEEDLDFPALSYQTAQPENMGENVEDLLIDNDDGTWLRRIDGDGFSAVFTCDRDGRNANLISYTILSDELEGPRCVRLGDLFHEDYQRFRSGSGELDATGTAETLYGTAGQPPYGLAEYQGNEMILRYVTKTMSGEEIELLMRYEETVLVEIILHTLSEE